MSEIILEIFTMCIGNKNCSKENKLLPSHLSNSDGHTETILVLQGFHKV